MPMTTMTTRVVATTTTRATATTRRARAMRKGWATTSSSVGATIHRCAERASVVARASEGGENEESDEYMFANTNRKSGALNRDNPELQERFAVIGQGDWQCQSCMYEYKPKVGDDFYPVSAGTQFKDLPDDWRCPTCGADKTKFKSLGKQVAGFEQNQGYGLGTNAMTEGEKSRLIYGSLAFFFLCFIAGYLMD